MDKVEKRELEQAIKAKIQRRIKANRIVGSIRFRDHFSTCPGRHNWDLCGHPVYWWVLKAAMDSKYLEKVIVCTEVEEALRTAERMSDKFVTIPRTLEECDEPAYHIVDDLKTSESRVEITAANRVEVVEKKLGVVGPLMVGLSPCNPLTTAASVDRLIEKYFEDDLAESAVLVSKVDLKLHTPDPGNPQYLLPVWNFSSLVRRQQYPPLYSLAGARIVSYEWMAQRAVYVEVPESEAIEIHDEKDLEKAKFYLEARLNASKIT